MMRTNNKFGLVSLIQVLNLVLILSLILTLLGCDQYSLSTVPLNQSPAESSRLSTIQPTIPTSVTTSTPTTTANPTPTSTALDEDGRYTTPEDVAAYLNAYQQLPLNFITKRNAMDLGWESEEGNLWDVTDELSIGGDIFGNREGLLPKKSGRVWYECDVNYQGGFRGAERIVYSNDGLIYYTEDHYQTFTQLY